MPERWQELKRQIKGQFPDLEERRGELVGQPGTYEELIFDGPLGEMRLEYVTRPVVLDKKTIGSKRIGGNTTVEYIYSDTEVSQQFHAYKWNEELDDWEEVKGFGG